MQVVATTPTLFGEKVDKTVEVGEERFGPNLGISRRLESKISSHIFNRYIQTVRAKSDRGATYMEIQHCGVRVVCDSPEHLVP